MTPHACSLRMVRLRAQLGLWMAWVLVLGGACAHLPSRELASSISGQVLDSEGAPLVGIEVQVQDPQGESRQLLTTDAEGRFVLTQRVDANRAPHPLRSGERLRISAWRPGFEPLEIAVRYPGGRLTLEPMVLLPEQQEIMTGLDEEAAPTAPPDIPRAGRTGRGE